MNIINVVKASGDLEVFNEDKLRKSISRAGVPQSLQDETLNHIKSRLRDNIPTSEIYSHILEFLGKSDSPYLIAKYSLKKAIMDLGPTGFPFEKFISRILAGQGYQVKTDVIISGVCVAHEVDVVAEKEDSKIMIECKFHNKLGNRTDIKVALYVMARYQDLTAGFLNRSNAMRFNQVWLVTNTKCSQEVIVYAKCMGMKIVSWGYPENGNLQDLVEKQKLHPITCLNNINSAQKKILLDNNIILAKDLFDNPLFLDLLNLPAPDKQLLLTEIRNL